MLWRTWAVPPPATIPAGRTPRGVGTPAPPAAAAAAGDRDLQVQERRWSLDLHQRPARSREAEVRGGDAADQRRPGAASAAAAKADAERRAQQRARRRVSQGEPGRPRERARAPARGARE